MTLDANVDFGRWLEALGLGQYARTFTDNDVGFDALRLLADSDLKELGLSLGHRRILQGAIQQLNPGRAAGPSAVGLAAGGAGGPGERRQITVMFCDLVGSSELSVRFDPEDLRNLIHAYYSSCCRIIEQSGGFVARIIGDGILAYFGYPTAREDAAECAIRAGLRIAESMDRERPEGAGRIDVRIGLATGVSVISEMVGIGFSELHAVMGQTPNVAARIQSLAEPGTVAIADETRRLAGGFFVYARPGLAQRQGLQRAGAGLARRRRVAVGRAIRRAALGAGRLHRSRRTARRAAGKLGSACNGAAAASSRWSARPASASRACCGRQASASRRRPA